MKLPKSIFNDYVDERYWLDRNRKEKLRRKKSEEKEAEGDLLYICPKCDKVWSSSFKLGFKYYNNMPKFQHKKICKNCKE